MTDKQREYRKEFTKRVVINLTLSDYERWRAAAELRNLPIATMIRKQVEMCIDDIETAEEKDIRDIREYQDSLKG